MADAQAEMRACVRDLLASGKVQVAIGYAVTANATRTKPLVITKAERADELVWNPHCTNNLATYLTRKEVLKHAKIALVVKGCDLRAAVSLMQEGQIARERVVLIGMACEGVGVPVLLMCNSCDAHTPKGCDVTLGTANAHDVQFITGSFPDVAALDAKPADARWAFWQEQFSRCLKCYACRQVCPMCYCTRCIVEKNQPQWVLASPHEAGNLAWNMIRAMHLAGRCALCGACERACPVHIPLMLLNKKMAHVVQERFGYRAGMDPAAVPAVRTFDKEDGNEFFR